jgi:hypothetical protein
MIYLSKGILPWKPSDLVPVSHCGALHSLTGELGELWLAGQHRPGYTQSANRDAVLLSLAERGIVECNDGKEDASLFRLLINCVICPVRVKTGISLLTRMERFAMRWIWHAGLRLTMAELTTLAERGIKPTLALLGEQNRQALTELIYSADTVFDGILETVAEKSPVRDDMVQAVLGLLKKEKIYLI